MDLTKDQMVTHLKAVRIVLTTCQWVEDSNEDTSWSYCPICIGCYQHKKDCEFPRVLAGLDEVIKELS